jgi:hypothetical protein
MVALHKAVLHTVAHLTVALPVGLLTWVGLRIWVGLLTWAALRIWAALRTFPDE